MTKVMLDKKTKISATSARSRKSRTSLPMPEAIISRATAQALLKHVKNGRKEWEKRLKKMEKAFRSKA